MNSYKEIGGYFELELDNHYNNIPNGVITLNTARNALRYVIRAYKIKEIYVPYYTCPVVWETIEKESCKINYYHIDNNFMPTEDLPNDAYILYTNYFGICAKNVKELVKKYKNLIVDNAQAFYMPKCGVASFNSVRKFFGVSDGALLQSDKILKVDFEQDTSYQRFMYLLKRVDKDAQFGYQDFQQNEASFTDEPIKNMSNLTKTMLNSIDTEKAKKIRLNNFEYLHNNLSNSNELKFNLDEDDVPMVYPYLIKKDSLRSKLIDNKIYVAQYWSTLPDRYFESYMQKYFLPLPIDQRYNVDNMNRIIEVINV